MIVAKGFGVLAWKKILHEYPVFLCYENVAWRCQRFRHPLLVIELDK